MKSTLFTLILILMPSGSAIAQFRIDGEIRPRFEYRHGFSTLFPDNTDASAFVSQRTRLNIDFKKAYLNFYLSVQDIRVWGDVAQLNRADRNGLGVHQAWGEIVFTPGLSLKFGRQVLNYDDQRVFGGVDWAQQARSHDLILLKYYKNATSLHLGAAFNQAAETNTGNLLTTENTYKSIQYGWFHQDWNSISASLLFLNNGLQFIDSVNVDSSQTRFSHTIGTHLNHAGPKFGVLSNLYYQFGNDVNNNDLNAYLIALEANYKIDPKWTITAGAELLSGNDGSVPSGGRNKAFIPFYGTNHKFNGLMDYFYVGNHADNVGLLDVYFGSNIGLGEKTSLNGRIHNFRAAADLQDTERRQLGVETDFVLNFNFKEDINLKVGYSHLFASEGMEVLKNNFDDNGNYWGWVMLTVNPVLFQNTMEN